MQKGIDLTPIHDSVQGSRSAAYNSSTTLYSIQLSQYLFPCMQDWYTVFCLIKTALLYSAKQSVIVFGNSKAPIVNCTYFSGTLVIGTTGDVVRCLYCDSCSMLKRCSIITSVELLYRGASQGLRPKKAACGSTSKKYFRRSH